MRKRTFPLALLGLLVLSLGCAGSRAFRDAREEEILQHWDLAVLRYTRALDLDPKNSRYRIALMRAKAKASQSHFERGKLYRSSGRPELAVVELEQTVVLDPTNQYAQTELRKARDEAAKVAAERSGETPLEALKRKTRGMRARPPILEPTSDKPINLNFPQPKPIKQIYQALALAAGINVIFDPQLKDDNVTIVLTNIEFQKALETLMRQENHFYKIIDDKTILIAADTPQNRKTYEDLVIRTFFLSNGDVTEVSNALRNLLQTTRISINKAENSITLRDTADKVAIAERIVEQNDKQSSEVVVDVELLQINTKKAQEIGLLLKPSYSVGASVPAPGGQRSNLGADIAAGNFTWDVIRNLSIRSFGFTIPTLTLDLIKNNSDAELLAKPQLRISEGQKAQLVIGDQVPIPTTVFLSQAPGSGGGVTTPNVSFQYRDVGIKIEVEPRVHHNREITLKLTLEVSQLGEPVTVAGQQQPVIGTRTISTNIRLKDGETNFLAGLFRNDKGSGSTGVPFLGDIPILGRLFSKKTREDRTTDLVLTLTPHIIRIPDITEEDISPVYVGTDANISFQGTPRIESPGGAGPFDFQRREPPPRPIPQPGALPAPVPLAPAGPPSDPFKPSPREAVPPQEPRPPGLQGALIGAAPPVFDFEPAFVSLGPGQQRSLIIRATGETLAASSLAILGEGGVADTRLEPGKVTLELPEATLLSGTRAIAEITLQGIAAGRASLTLQSDGAGSTSAVIEVR